MQEINLNMLSAAWLIYLQCCRRILVCLILYRQSFTLYILHHWLLSQKKRQRLKEHVGKAAVTLSIIIELLLTIIVEILAQLLWEIIVNNHLRLFGVFRQCWITSSMNGLLLGEVSHGRPKILTFTVFWITSKPFTVRSFVYN